MIRRPDSAKRYGSAKGRFLKPMIKKFFQKEFPQLFGPVVREKIAEEKPRSIRSGMLIL
jgi:hypothetical protein